MINTNLTGAELIVEARRVVETCEKEEVLGLAYNTVNIDEILQLEKQLRKVLISMSGREVYFRISRLIEAYYKLNENTANLSLVF